MADLDDFFAKKDKKKGKTKKYISSEELVKQLEQSAKEMAAEKQKPAKIDEEAEQIKITNKEQDDEWNEFEEQKRPDLSNLKLGQLTIGEDEENNFNNAGNDYENENLNIDGDNSENPWNKANSSGPAPVETKPTPAPQPVKTGAYVVPAERQQPIRNRSSRKNAPDLQNQDNFPSLGTEKPAEPPRPSKKDGFEEVKHGSKFQSADANTVPVSTGNVYSSLRSDDS